MCQVGEVRFFWIVGGILRDLRSNEEFYEGSLFTSPEFLRGPKSGISKPVVCMRVAFHESDGKRESTKTTKTSQTATNKELSAGLAETKETPQKWRKQRKSGAQTTGAPNNGFRNTRLTRHILPSNSILLCPLDYATSNDSQSSVLLHCPSCPSFFDFSPFSQELGSPWGGTEY